MILRSLEDASVQVHGALEAHLEGLDDSELLGRGHAALVRLRADDVAATGAVADELVYLRAV